MDWRKILYKSSQWSHDVSPQMFPLRPPTGWHFCLFEYLDIWSRGIYAPHGWMGPTLIFLILWFIILTRNQTGGCCSYSRHYMSLQHQLVCTVTRDIHMNNCALATRQSLHRGRWICQDLFFCSCHKSSITFTCWTFHGFTHFHSVALVPVRCDVEEWKEPCTLLFRKQQHISVFTTPPPTPPEIFSADTWKRKPCDHGWTLRCPVSLILLTGQQAAYKSGLFSRQTNKVERCSQVVYVVNVWIFWQCSYITRILEWISTLNRYCFKPIIGLD